MGDPVSSAARIVPARPLGRRAGFWAALGAVVLAHLSLLGEIGLGPGPQTPEPVASVQVRRIEPPSPPSVALPEPAPTVPAAAPLRPVAARVPAAARPASAAQPAAAVSEATPAVVAPMVAVAVAAAPAVEVAASAVEPIAAASEGERPPPTYRTKPPGPWTLQYDLQRGNLHGSGELLWRRLDADRYLLRLDGRVLGLQVLVQESAGGVDAAGLVPERFTDQRGRRAPIAANFDAAAARVTFSSTAAALPLVPGAQDRLSWMLQLAAVVAADAALAVPEATVAMQVVGARGDASVWTFRCTGPERLRDGAGGGVDVLRYERLPRSERDTAVQVWLDPARDHLPVRAQWRQGDAEALELRLREATPGA